LVWLFRFPDGGDAGHHEIGLISTIAVGLVYALIGGYVAKRGYFLRFGPFKPCSSANIANATIA
jgi:hypothetical protein